MTPDDYRDTRHPQQMMTDGIGSASVAQNRAVVLPPFFFSSASPPNTFPSEN